MFDGELAAVYDTVYRARGQDFALEAERIAEIVLARRPDAASLLDAGCGTGEHLATLRRLFDHVAGLDLSPSMVAVARKKLPAVPIRVEDLVSFELGRSFDAVISLSAALAYLPSRQAMHRAVDRLARHLSPGGVLVVEPWYFPENFTDGHVASDLLRAGGQTISRVSHTREHDGAASIESHYVVAGRHGIQHFTEVHIFQLWSRETYAGAIRSAGCTAEYIAGLQSGRGVFVGQRG